MRRPVEPGLEGPEGNVERVGRLAVAQPEVVMQHENGALFRGQPPKPAIDAIPTLDRRVPTWRRDGVGRQERDLEPPPTSIGPRRPIAAANEQSMQPRV